METERSGKWFTITWNWQANFQNPPLQFWILAGTFRVFGENDFAARLPSLVMCLGILVLLYRVGLLLFGQSAATGAVAWLLLCPYLLKSAGAPVSSSATTTPLRPSPAGRPVGTSRGE